MSSNDKLNEEAIKDWNASITPRLSAMHSWFQVDEWQKGLKPFLNSVLDRRREHLERQANEPYTDQFIKGQIAMLKEIMAVPAAIDNQLAQIEKKKNVPAGDAGY